MTLSQLLGSVKQRWSVHSEVPMAYTANCGRKNDIPEQPARRYCTSESGLLGVSAKSIFLLLFAREILSHGRDRTKFSHSRRQRERKRGSRDTLPGPGGPERVPKPDWVAYVLIFLASIICRLCKLTLSDQDHVTASECQPFWFSVNVCSRSVPA